MRERGGEVREGEVGREERGGRHGARSENVNRTYCRQVFSGEPFAC